MTALTHEVIFGPNTSKSVSELLRRVDHDDDWVIRRSDLEPRVAAIIETVLKSIAAGEDVSIARVPEEVTTTTAAKMLGVSRPTLMKHVRAGDLPSHSVGSHTRLHRDDVLEFRKELRAAKARAIQELMELEDELGEPL